MANTSQHGMNPKKGGLTATHIILIVGFLLVIAAIIVVFFLLRPKPVEPEVRQQGNFVVDDANLGTIGDEMTSQVERGMFETYMNTTWSFPDGKSPSTDALVGNSSANRYDFYFEVILTDTEEVIYTSSVVPIGRTLKEIKLDKELPAGTYQATCMYHLIDENGEDQDGNVGFNITIRIAA